MGFCSYCGRDISKKDLIICTECNSLVCKKCYVNLPDIKKCIKCYTLHIEEYQEEFIQNDILPEIS
jgi:hypothetical protein